ncbi:protein of unknown function DUF62 [Chloroherpeton thalassium ATCC 35110]|uniref:SAM-dependent chlorinase/fluorinase n=1 Tax=Chloroherpeton thalassium (strain ATCC 35110 / GB-78) TaxID=517418 RepID=B3QT68_CHLT3|nr:SAM-dependent chlorinase/fluorinase [Chloroherpeton thalassium]ACF14167.1 protein of unknown function DUF62 [Chloroherpeton thalassium ATCC 35110]
MTIVLLTDFGLSDTYVGIMKGVIAGIAPNAKVIDLTHDIRPQDVRHGAYALKIAAPYFPAETIFVAVVDPGVGSNRQAIAVRANNQTFIVPNNGLLSHIVHEYGTESIVLLENERYRLKTISSTFHGRDIFSPAAAHLAHGVEFADLGRPLANEELVLFAPPKNEPLNQNSWRGEIIHIDRFGNLISSLTAEEISQESSNWLFSICNATVSKLSKTYTEVAEGELVAYIGSDGFLEVGMRNGHAAERLRARLGDEIRARKVK